MADRNLVEKILRDAAYLGFMSAKLGGDPKDRLDLDTEVELLCGMLDAERQRGRDDDCVAEVELW